MGGICCVLHAHSIKLLKKLLVRTIAPGRNHHKRKNLGSVVLAVFDSSQCIKEYINSLVLVLVSSTDSYKYNVVAILHTVHCRCYLKQFLAGFLPACIKFVVSRHKAVVKSVWSNDVNFSFYKLSALCGCNVTHCSEYICIVRCCLL